MHNLRKTFISTVAILFAIAIGTAAYAPSGHAAPIETAKTDTRKNEDARDHFEVRSSDGTTLAVTAQGAVDAPEILLIHGLRQSHLSWEKQLSDPTLKGFRIVTFDLRGHGDSDKPAALAAYSDADKWADDVNAVISGAKLRRPVLVGWSLGGYVAGAYLRKYGGTHIAGINLVDAVTNMSPNLFTSEALGFAKSTTSHNLATRAAATADFLFTCFYQAPTPSALHQMMVINGMTSRAVYEGFLQTKTTNLEPFFAAYNGPVLLSHGIHDRLVKVAMSERIKSIHANSRLSVFDNSGHSPFYEEPARFNEELADFVKEATAK